MALDMPWLVATTLISASRPHSPFLSNLLLSYMRIHVTIAVI